MSCSITSSAAAEVVADQRPASRPARRSRPRSARRPARRAAGSVGLRGERAHDPEPALVARAAARRRLVARRRRGRAARAARREPPRRARGACRRRRAPTSTFSSTVRPREEPHALERAREAARGRAGAALQPVTSTPSSIDRAGGRLLEAGERVDERRLAGAVRADQAEDLALRELEVDAVDRLARPRSGRRARERRRRPRP